MTSGDEGYVWVADFEEDALEKFYEKFSRLEGSSNVEVIPIIISSYGGQVHVMTAMRDMIKSCNKPVCTVAIGKAMSCGAMLLAAGTPGMRFASKDASIMIHEVSSGSYGKAEELKNDAKYTEYLNKLMFRNLSDDTGMTVEFFFKKMHEKSNTDWFLTAEEAKKIGLIDFVDLPRVMSTSSILTMIRNRRPGLKSNGKDPKQKDKSKAKAVKVFKKP